jgi:hypothetical protein
MQARSLLITALSGVLTGGCLPLPIPHTEMVAPAIHGRMIREDGSPIRGRTVATARWGGARSCQRPGAPATTDSNGEFDLPATEQRQKVLWLTMMERFGPPPFTVCAGAAEDSTTRRADALVGVPQGEAMACMEWRLEETVHLTCGPDSLVARRDGAWRSGDNGGALRLIPKEENDAPFYSLGHLQWIGHDPTTGLDRVYATIPVVTLDRAASTAATRFVEHDGRWFLEATDLLASWPSKAKVIRYEIGGPGELWRLPDTRE